MAKHEFTYDIKMVAVIRISAGSKRRAASFLADAIDGARLVIECPHDEANGSITNSMIYVDDETEPYLIEIDGVPVDL
jgi:hypothetical protein